MDQINHICSSLERKKELFAEYEKCTDALVDCDADDMNNYITQRAQLAIEIDKIDAEILCLCEGEENPGLCKDAVTNRCNYGDLPRAMQAVFLAAQEIFSVINRIMAQEPNVLNRMQTLSEHYKEQVAATQQTPKIVRYLSGMSGQDSSGGYMERYSKA